MPRLLIHALIGFPVSLLVAYLSGPLAGLIFFMSSLFVDIDHLVGYYIITKDWTWNVRNEYVSMSKWWKRVSVLPSGELEPKYLHWQFLHRIELWIVVTYFAPNPLSMIGAGALSNIFLDVVEWPKRIKYMTVATDIVRLALNFRS
jgi:hypothetical protein